MPVTSKSIVTALSKVKLDSARIGRHTQSKMTRSSRALVLPTPLAARFAVLGLVILTVIVILPH
jgi:hypothetical protein